MNCLSYRRLSEIKSSRITHHYGIDFFNSSFIFFCTSTNFVKKSMPSFTSLKQLFFSKSFFFSLQISTKGLIEWSLLYVLEMMMIRLGDNYLFRRDMTYSVNQYVLPCPLLAKINPLSGGNFSTPFTRFFSTGFVDSISFNKIILPKKQCHQSQNFPKTSFT